MAFINKLKDIGGVDNFTSLLVYALIILLFIFGFIKCVVPVMRTRSTLRGAIRAIKSGGKQRSWQEDHFLGRGALYPHWSEYLNNLFFADGVYHNASNVEDYINDDTVIYGPGNTGFSEALPGLMVSLGFMGTLIGLAVGLSGFDMADESSIMTSIETLIPGMRYAFMTSIVGVVCSVSFTIITRVVNGSASRAVVGFYGAMSRHAGVLSVDPMTQVAIYQQEQTALIQTMAKDLNGEFTQRITSAIKDATVPLQDSMTKFVTVSTQEQMRFLDTVVTRFVSRMDQALSGQFDNLADVIDETVRNQQRLLTAVDNQVNDISKSSVEIKQVETQITSMLDRLEQYVSKLASSQKQLDDAYSRVASGIEQSKLVARQQADYVLGVSKLQNSVSDMASEIAKTTGSIENSARALAASGDRIEKLRAAMNEDAKTAAAQLSAANAQAMAAARDELSRTLDSMEQYMRAYTARVDDVTGAIGEEIARLPEAVSETSRALTEQIERLAATLSRAQRSLDDTVDRMYGK